MPVTRSLIDAQSEQLFSDLCIYFKEEAESIGGLTIKETGRDLVYSVGSCTLSLKYEDSEQTRLF